MTVLQKKSVWRGWKIFWQRDWSSGGSHDNQSCRSGIDSSTVWIILSLLLSFFFLIPFSSLSFSLSLTRTHPHRHSQHLPVNSHYLLHSSPLVYHQNLNYYCNIVSWLFLLFIDPASPFYCPSCADHIRHGVWHHWYRLWMLHHLWVN